MSCERQIPYAVMNWRILIEEDFFFVDHTRYLHDLEKYRTPVFLRPKRFGKSLWASMLEHYYVKRRIPAQAYDHMNENFFRTTFASRTLDALPMFYTIKMEYNTPAGRCDFLAVPKPGLAKDAMLVEFKYFSGAEAKRLLAADRAEPDAETLAQARRYRDSLPARPGWDHTVETAVVEVYGNVGYKWFPVED